MEVGGYQMEENKRKSAGQGPFSWGSAYHKILHLQHSVEDVIIWNESSEFHGQQSHEVEPSLQTSLKTCYIIDSFRVMRRVMAERFSVSDSRSGS